MPKGVAFLSSSLGAAHAQMAQESLKAAAHRRGYELQILLSVDEAAMAAGEAARSGAYERVILSGALVTQEEQAIIVASVSELIRHPEKFLPEEQESASQVVVPVRNGAASPAPATVQLVAITSCPTGIAHTFMAAAALKKSAEELGYAIRIETQGSVGAKNTLTEEEIRHCSAAIIAADTHVDDSRFAGVRLYKTGTDEAIHHGKELIAKALALPLSTRDEQKSKSGFTTQKKERTGAYKHLMTGVSHMLPLVTAGGLLIALAFAIGGIHAGDQTGTLGWALMQIGSATAFKLYIAVLSAYIAYSIADRPGICPGLIGGMLSMTLGAGFLGGIASGFLAGYVTKLLNDRLPLPEALAGLKPVLLLPVLSTLIVGLAMIFVIGHPVKYLFDGMTLWLSSMQQGSAVVLGILLGAMMAFDMGGPVNKAAYTFSVGLLASNVHQPMAAAMVAGMTPPLGIAVATLLFRHKFNAAERNEGKVTAILGLAFVTEGAIPFAAKDPLRVIPCLMAGSALAGAIAMANGCALMVPHGGVFVLLIPHAITSLRSYALAMVAGSLLTGVLLGLVKRRSVQ